MTEALRQRDPRIEDEQHLDYVRSQPCCVCGKPPRSQAAHIRGNWGRPEKRSVGALEKPHDKWTVPMCNPIIGRSRGCHGDQHHRGDEEAYWREKGVDPFAIAERLWTESGAESRHAAADRRPTRKPRKPRPRPKMAKRTTASKKIKRTWPRRTFPTGRGFAR